VCTIDWPLLATLLGALGSLLNALLVVWLILVTKRYVAINAHLLVATRDAVNIATDQSQHGKATLALLQRQQESQTLERIGPLIAALAGLTSKLEAWHAYVNDIARYAKDIAAAPDVSFAGETRQLERIVSTVSLLSFRHLSKATKIFALVDRELHELQARLRRLDGRAVSDPATLQEIQRQVVALIDSAASEVALVEAELQKLIPDSQSRQT